MFWLINKTYNGSQLGKGITLQKKNENKYYPINC